MDLMDDVEITDDPDVEVLSQPRVSHLTFVN